MTRLNKEALKIYIIVAIQLAGLLYVAISAPLFADSSWLLIIEVLGIILALWAILVMNPFKVRILPFPNPSVEMLQKGPYRIIRHPMYTSIFLVVGSLVMSYYTIYRLMVLIILFAFLVLKVHIEESLLENHYENYRLYKKKTFRFFPFIY